MDAHLKRPDLPKRLFRVQALIGFGYPDVRYREVQSRNFQRADGAARWIANLARWPRHHRLLGVFVADTDWTELAAEDLGEPPEPAEEEWQ